MFQVPLSAALTSVTQAPARVLGLKQKGQLAVGKDADMLLLNSHALSIDTVIAKGRCLVKDGRPRVYGTFEKPQQFATGG